MPGRAFTATVVKTLAPLRDRPDSRLEVRVLETPAGRRLDVREHITSDGFTGYTRKGICIDAEAFQLLLDQAEEITGLLEGRRG